MGENLTDVASHPSHLNATLIQCRMHLLPRFHPDVHDPIVKCMQAHGIKAPSILLQARSDLKRVDAVYGPETKQLTLSLLQVKHERKVDRSTVCSSGQEIETHHVLPAVIRERTEGIA